MLVSLLILTFKGKARDFREIDDLYQPAFWFFDWLRANGLTL
jgi:hypothetical protein